MPENLISNSTFSKLTGYKDLLNKDENSEEEIIHKTWKKKILINNPEEIIDNVKFKTLTQDSLFPFYLILTLLLF